MSDNKYIDKSYLTRQFVNFIAKINTIFSKVGHKHTTSDISNFPTIPRKMSELENDNNYLKALIKNPNNTQL